MTPFYADEDFSKSVVGFLRDFGFDVLPFRRTAARGKATHKSSAGPSNSAGPY
jgi:hypothetical protein